MFTIAMDYTLNIFNVPAVGYGGEIDPQLQASRNIQAQIEREGLKPSDLRSLFLVGPNTAHKFHPDSKKESDAFVNKAVAERQTSPDHIRFVTYTTRYNECFWITLDQLEKTVRAGRSGRYTERRHDSDQDEEHRSIHIEDTFQGGYRRRVRCALYFVRKARRTMGTGALVRRVAQTSRPAGSDRRCIHGLLPLRTPAGAGSRRNMRSTCGAIFGRRNRGR